MAPIKVRSLFHGFAGLAEVVEVSAEALALQREFIRACIVPEIYHDDALHVALATVSACGLIVSWNFKHIVNFRKIPLYNGISQKNGYPAVSIHSPLEVIENESGEDL